MRPILLGLLCLLLLLPSAQPAFGAKIQAEEIAPLTYWRIGFMLNTPPTASNLPLVPATSAVRLSSTLNQSDHYLTLPTSTLVQIQAVSLLLFDRSGSYPGTLTAHVEVYNLDTGYKRTLSITGLDLQTATNNAWTSIPLEGNRILTNKEVLVIHFQRDGGVQGDLELGVGLEVIGQNLTVYMPVISR